MNYLNNNITQVKLIESSQEFDSLREKWDFIARHSGEFYPFCCHGWFRIWLSHFLKDDKINFILLNNDEHLLAIAPFILMNSSARGIKINKLELAGNVYSPIRNFITDFSQNDKVTTLINILYTHMNEWDIADLSALPGETSCFDQIKNALIDSGLVYKEYFCFGDWYQDEITCTGEEYIYQLPDKMKKDIQYCKRRLEREGQLEIRVVTTKDDLEHYLDLYYNVYSKSWQKQENLGPTFHRDLAVMAADKGWLRLGFLIYEGVPLAAQFWLVANNTAYILKTVYDQNYKKHSAGKILTSEMFKYVIDIDNVTTIDYVQGDEDYKKYWTPKRRERKGIVIYNNTLKGRYLSLVDTKIIPFINNNRHLSRLKLAIGKRLR